MTVRVHQQIAARTDDIANRLGAVNSQLREMVHLRAVGHLARHVVKGCQLDGIETGVDRPARVGGKAGRGALIGRAIDIGVNPDPLLDATAEQLMGGHAQGLALQVPQALLKPAGGNGRRGAAEIAAIARADGGRSPAKPGHVENAAAAHQFQILFEERNAIVVIGTLGGVAQPGQAAGNLEARQGPVSPPVDAHMHDLKLGDGELGPFAFRRNRECGIPCKGCARQGLQNGTPLSHVNPTRSDLPLVSPSLEATGRLANAEICAGRRAAANAILRPVSGQDGGTLLRGLRGRIWQYGAIFLFDYANGQW